jgi:hypothetical protein
MANRLITSEEFLRSCCAPNSQGRCQRTFPCMVGKCSWLIEEAIKVATENSSFLTDPNRQYDPSFAKRAEDQEGEGR